jgi:adenosylcobinamide-phosphate synthase
MKFLSIVIALLLEQARPLRRDNPMRTAYARYAELLEGRLNGGEFRHGAAAWLLAVVPAAVLIAVVYALLYRLSPFVALVWSVLVLYATMGFRQFSHYYTEIQQSLREGQVAAARDRLNVWRGGGASEFTLSEVARVSIELGLVAANRHVFGPVMWFLVLGPAGAAVYRMAAWLDEEWGRRVETEFGDFGSFARRCFFWLDWLPARLTAASFAIVGDFEDAVYCWRNQARSWAAKAQDVILASGGGALGVRLGDALHEYDGVELRAELGTGDEADVDHMQGAVGLIWRALVLWVFLVFLLTVAHSLG